MDRYLQALLDTFLPVSPSLRSSTTDASIASSATTHAGVSLHSWSGLHTGLRSNVLYFKQHLDFAVNAPFFRMPHYSPLLHNAILAIALGFSDEPYLRNPALRLKFAEQAKTFIDEEGMRPSIATVQAFAHLASYHSLAAEHNLGWLYMGMGVRCAVAREHHKWIACS